MNCGEERLKGFGGLLVETESVLPSKSSGCEPSNSNVVSVHTENTCTTIDSTLSQALYHQYVSTPVLLATKV